MRLISFSRGVRVLLMATLMLNAVAVSTAALAASPSSTESALEKAQRDLNRAERLYGPNDEGTAKALLDLALAHRKQGDNAAAQPLLTRALAIYDRAKAPDPIALATVLNSLGAIYHEQNNPREARPLLQRALSITEAYFKTNPDHPAVITVMGNLAGVHSNLGERNEAQLLYRRLAASSEKAFGPDDSRTQKYRNMLAMTTQLLANEGGTVGDSIGERLSSRQCESMRRTVETTQVPPNASVTASTETVMFMTKTVLDMIDRGCPDVGIDRASAERSYKAAEDACNAVQSGGRPCVPRAHAASESRPVSPPAYTPPPPTIRNTLKASG